MYEATPLNLWQCGDKSTLPLDAARSFAAEYWQEPRKVTGFRPIDATSAMFRIVGGNSAYSITFDGERGAYLVRRLP